MKLLKRTLAMLLVLTMVLGMVPFAAFAEETTEGTEGTLPVPTHMATKPADGTVTGQPFNDAKSVSRNYRIPGLVNHNGTLIATADVRYNAEKDGGGIDIVVSRSADGNTWNYTFPAYLGDNGNEYNGESSTIMDPLIISDGETLYLLYDLFSAGYSLGTWNTTYGFWATGTGFDSQGRLRLGTTYNGAEDSWNYYLENGQIKDSSGNAVAGYTVDAWFNVYQNGTYVSNLFFKDSPYMVYPTSYIAMQTSTDGGSNWSDPQLLNIKENGPTWEVLGPGTGLVTTKGELAFTTYDNTNIYLIHGKDNDWSIVKTPSATNESSIVELADGTIRAFVKNKSKTISYVDFTPNGDSYTAGAAKSTGIPNTGWCMVSSLVYSKTIDGEDVILVCCPKGSNDDTRRFGTLHAFKAESMELVGSYQIDTGYTDQFFAYSDMAELDNGKLALIYEDGCGNYKDPPWNNTPAGSGYSHISYTEIDLETALGVKFDVDYDVFVWNADNSAGEIRVPTTAGVNHVHVRPATVDGMTMDYDAYDMVLCKDEEDGCAEFACANVHTDKAIVSLALTDALKAADDVKGFVVEADGSINSVFDVENDGEYVTFEAPHFSVVGIAAMTEEEIAQKNAEEITLYVGETMPYIDDSGNYADAENTSPDASVATMVVEAVETVAGSLAVGEAVTAVTEGKYVIYTYRGAYVANSPDGNYIDLSATETVWQVAVADADAGTYYVTDSNGKYLYVGNNTAGITDTQTAVKLVYATGTDADAESGFYIKDAAGSYNLNNSGGTNNAYGKSGANGSWSIWQLKPCTEVPGQYGTKITFTGEGKGNTEAIVGGTVYNITVKERIVQDITLTAGETETFTIADRAYSMDDVTTHPNGTYAKLDSVVATVPAMVPVTAIESGKQYLIVNRETGDVLSDTVVIVPGQNDDKTGLDSKEKASADSTELWTIAAVDGKHTVAQGDRYLTVAGFYANMSDTETKLTLEYTDSGWTIYDNTTYQALGHDGPGYYLSDNVGEGHTSGALGINLASNTARYWDLYEVYPEGITTVTFTGVAEGGPTTAVIGDVTYNITVEASKWINVDVSLYVDETKTITDETGNYTVSQPPAADIATATVAGQDITETTVSTEKATVLESGATYVIKLAGTDKAMSNQAGSTAWNSETRALVSFTGQAAEEHVLWTLEPAQGGYKLKNGNGSYLQLTRNAAPLTADGHVFEILYDGGVWTFQNVDNKEYFNNLDGKNCIGGWSGNDTKFDLYKVNTTVTGRTEITFTGVAEGDTQAIIGNTRYNIYVTEREQEIVDVDLYVGETKNYTIDGTAYTDANVTKADNADTVVQTQVVGDYVDGKELRVATEIISGRKYMLMNTRVDETLRNVPNGNRLFLDGTLNAEDTTAIWTITAVEGRENGYTVQDANNKYLKIPAGGQAGLSDTSITLIIEPNGTDDGNVQWQIKHGGQYLNSHDSSNDAGGYNVDGDRGSQWVLYEVAESTTEVSFTGLTEGETQVKVGHVTYNITVSYYEEDVTAFVGAPVSVIPNGTVTQAAIDDFNAAHGGKVTVALSNGKLVFNGVAETDEFTAILGNTRYSIAVIRAVENITLYEGLGATFTIEGFNYTTGTIADSSSATLDKVEAKVIPGDKRLVAITSEDQIVSGKSYLIATGNNNSVLTSQAQTTTTLDIGSVASVNSTELWTFTGGNGVYTISPAENSYLNLADATRATVTNTAQSLTVEWLQNASAWTIAGTGTNKYLNNNANANDYATTYSQADAGSQWYLYEIVSDEDQVLTEVTFTGVKAGTTTTATVGHVTYNITVEKNDIRNITLYVGVTQNDFIEGFGYDNTHSTQPDNTYAYIHSVTAEDGSTKVVFSGVAKTPEGKVITATVGHVTYEITVKDLHSGEDVPGFNCVIGEGEYASGAGVTENLNGKEVKSLRISEGMEFNLGVDITDADTITWENTDPTIATVDETGKITAVSEGTALITATVTKNGVSETMAVHVTVVPSMVEGYSADEICHVVYYIDTVHMTDPFYTMFLSSENTTGPVAEHTMVMVSQGEVIVLQRPKNTAFAMVWTSDPWDNHALTYMAATGTLGEYYPLQSDNGVLETGTVNGIEYYKGCTAYNNIINAGNAAGASWRDAFDALLEYNVHVGEDIWQEFGCDGAMSMSRGSTDGHPNTATSLSFISEKLPEVNKTINGILPASGNQSDWQLYQEGMYASVGQHVYFTLSVTQDAPLSWQRNQDGSIKLATDEEGNVLRDDEGNALQLAALVYQGTANLVDRLRRPVTDENGNTTYEPITQMANPPYFYTKELDIQDGDQVDNGDGDAAGYIDGFIVNQALKKNSQDIVNDLNKGWTAEEIAAGQRTLEYYVVYTIQESDKNTLLVNGAGLSYEYSSAYSAGAATKTGTAAAKLYVLGASLGDVVVDFGQPVTIDGLTSKHMADRFNEKNTNNAIDGALYGYVDIDQKEDGTYSVTYTPDTILQGYDVVYLMDEYNNLLNYFRVYPATTVYYEESFLLNNNNGWTRTPGTDAGNQAYETLEQKVNPYGYDPIYANSLQGSAASFISANTIGANTSFTFTGTGFDLYANCAPDSGYVAITVRKNNADDSKTVVKLMTVNTKAKVGDTAATAGQGVDQYHMPIVSVQDLDHATYTVEIRKILQIERDVVIDGVRIYNTVADTSVFKENLEDAPKFFEMRDYVLKEIGIRDDTSGQYGSLAEMAGQIYAGIVEDNEVPKAVITDNDTIFGKDTVQDLLDNGPKNELFLYANQSLTFKVNTSRMMQLGLKAPTGAPATYQILVNGATVKEGTMNTSVDMFYNLNDPTSVNIANQATTITATGGKENSDEGSANLVDGNNSSLYKFYDAQMTDEQSVILTYEKARSMNAMAIDFENVGETDGDNYAFTYSILARNGSGEYDTIVDHATANRTDDSSQSYTFPEKTYSEVKIVMHSCKSGENNGWPAIAEFEVYSGVEYTVTVTNTSNAILSVTKLKICDDPNAKFVPLAVEDIELILLAAGYPADEEEGDTTTPSTPEATTPEETKPVETTPEESKPVVTTPEETKPEATTPEETKPENTGCAKDDTCILSKFSDIVATEWYHDGVHFCVAEGLMNGMGEGIFAPNDPTTRAQLVTMLYRLMGNPKAEGKTEPFTDVAEGEWYYDAIVWAYSENVVKGISETEFAPNANVTREQVATILHRFLATPEGTGKLDSFSDAASVSTYAKDALVWAVGEGLINGVAQTDGKVLLDHTGTATRAQIATILYRYLENA